MTGDGVVTGDDVVGFGDVAPTGAGVIGESVSVGCCVVVIGGFVVVVIATSLVLMHKFLIVPSITDSKVSTV